MHREKGVFAMARDKAAVVSEKLALAQVCRRLQLMAPKRCTLTVGCARLSL